MKYIVKKETFGEDIKIIRNQLSNSFKEFVDHINDSEFAISVNTLIRYEKNRFEVPIIKQYQLINQIKTKYKELLEAINFEIEYKVD